MIPRYFKSGISSVVFQRLRWAMTWRRFHLNPMRRCSVIVVISGVVLADSPVDVDVAARS